MTSRPVPPQLRPYDLIRVRRESKRPVVGPEHVEPLPVIQQWVADGGNYGVRATADDDLVVIDVDDSALRAVVRSDFPATFVVETGGGEHYYFQCAGRVENRQLTRDGADLGSIRATNWYAVGPGSVHPSGARYRVAEDRPLSRVGADVLDACVRRFGRGVGGGQRPPAAARRAGGRGVPTVPAGYPSRSAEWSALRRWLASNGLLGRLASSATDDGSGDEFVVAKCLAEGGFSEASIRSALGRRPAGSKWHRRGEDYRRRTVRKAIAAAVADEYVSFGVR